MIEASWAGAAAAPGDLPDEVLAALADEMSARDPQAEVLLDLTCPTCGASWQTVFDIAAYFWAELAAEAKRLLREVDALARVYGWREADILALSPVAAAGVCGDGMDFLTRLAQRMTGELPAVQPRLPARFEAAASTRPEAAYLSMRSPRKPRRPDAAASPRQPS